MKKDLEKQVIVENDNSVEKRMTEGRNSYPKFMTASSANQRKNSESQSNIKSN